MKGMDMSDMDGMKMGAASMAPGGSTMPAMPDETHRPMQGMQMSNDAGLTPFPQPGPNTKPIAEPAAGAEEVKLAWSKPVKMHVGPQVVSAPMVVSSRLNDPGDGLENNGRRVLTYADLRARYRGVDGRPPTREIELHLTGNMERFIWGFNGQKFSSAEPIELKLGERVRIVLINDTMMEHPIHLHGLWSELENGHGAFNPYKHTIIVKPAERVSYLVSADTPGRWAYHCHLLYHMHAGMFRSVVVS
jgi:FtsP/CotA-like multicopper oxidase with cupredoxin domain